MGMNAETHAVELPPEVRQPLRLPRSYRSRWPLGKLLPVCALPVVAPPIRELLGVLPWASSWPLSAKSKLVSALIWGDSLLMLAFAGGVLCFVVASCLASEKRPWAARAALSGLVLAVALFVGFRLEWPIRQIAMHRMMVEQGAPLVQAIRAHEAKYGVPPPTLAALVPEFLPAVPELGMLRYPDLFYYTGLEALHLGGDPWALEVESAPEFSDKDLFLYFPQQDYSGGDWGRIERVGEWGYVHE